MFSGSDGRGFNPAAATTTPEPYSPIRFSASNFEHYFNRVSADYG